MRSREATMPVLVTLALLLLLVVGSSVLAATRAANGLAGSEAAPNAVVEPQRNSAVVDVMLDAA